jgi:protein-tyrosine kinase
MSKIYEALQLAQRERKGVVKPNPASLLEERQSYMDPAFENEMHNIYRNINLALPKPAPKVIQFIGALEGEGTSTIARMFARMSSELLGKPVLLLDVDRGEDAQRPRPPASRRERRADALPDEEPDGDGIYRVGDTNLYMSLASSRSGFLTRDIYSAGADDFLQDLRQRFDLVFIDSPPAAKSPDGVALAGRADGVILVVEADRTRWPVAEKLRDEIVKNGGNILGVVLNKRRYYIPEFLYKRL